MSDRYRDVEQDDLLRPRLNDIIDLRHELVKLAGLIDSGRFEREWARFFPAPTDRPATPWSVPTNRDGHKPYLVLAGSFSYEPVT